MVCLFICSVMVKSHLEELYEKDTDASRKGIRLVPKLKYEHVHLTSFSKIRVDLASQVSIYNNMILHK